MLSNVYVIQVSRVAFRGWVIHLQAASSVHPVIISTKLGLVPASLAALESMGQTLLKRIFWSPASSALLEAAQARPEPIRVTCAFVSEVSPALTDPIAWHAQRDSLRARLVTRLAPTVPQGNLNRPMGRFQQKRVTVAKTTTGTPR